jgi:hypothetical protein
MPIIGGIPGIPGMLGMPGIPRMPGMPAGDIPGGVCPRIMFIIMFMGFMSAIFAIGQSFVLWGPAQVAHTQR